MSVAILTPEGFKELRVLKEKGRRLVGYFCVYVPVEIIYASGALPVRLARADEDSARCGEGWLRADACPFCKASVGRFTSDPLYQMLDGLVMVNTCDMMRRLAEVLAERIAIPLFQLYLPRTAEQRANRIVEWTEQLRCLYRWAQGLTGVKVDDGGATEQLPLLNAIADYNRVRGLLQQLDRLRAMVPARLKASEIFDLVAQCTRYPPEMVGAWLKQEYARRTGGLRSAEGAEATAPEPAGLVSDSRPRLMLAGSILVEEDRLLLELIEEQADVVADAVCTGMRWFTEMVADGEPLTEIARFYFNRTPCAFRRPNTVLYDYLRRLIQERQVKGVVYKTLFYCDPWRFEIKRMRQELGLPVLEIDGDYCQENRAQLRTRVEAFLEMLR